MSEISGAIEADSVVAEIEVSEHLVLDEVLRQLPRSLVSYLIIGEIEFYQRSVERKPWKDEFEQLIIDEVAGKVEDKLHNLSITRF